MNPLKLFLFLLLFVTTQLFSQKLYPIIENEKYLSFIDITGQRVKGPFELVDECFYNDCSQSFGGMDLRSFDPYLRYKEKNKIGIINKWGDVIVSPTNDTIVDFGYSKKFYSIVSINGKQGVLDSGGVWRVDAKYKKVTTSFQYTNDDSKLFFTCCKDSIWGLLDKDGKQIIPFIYDAAIERFGYTELWLLNKNGKFGLCNNKGVLVQDTIYSNILFKDNNGYYGIVETFDNKQGYITQEGKMFFRPTSSLKGGIVKKNMFDFYGANDKIGLLDSTGKQIAPPVYDYMEKLGDEVIVQQKNKWGMINKNAKLVIPCLYDKINKVMQGNDDNKEYVIVKLKELYGVYTMQGKLVIPVKYSDIGYRYIDGKFDFKLGNKSGIVNSKGVEIIRPQHDHIVNIYKNSYIYTKNDKYGLGTFTDLANVKKKMYDDVTKITIDKEVYYTRLNGKWGLIDSTGNTLLEPEYSYIKSIDDAYLWSYIYSGKYDSAYAKTLPADYLSIERDGKFAIYSVSKKWLSNFEFDDVDYYRDGLLEVKKGGKKMLLNIAGKDVRNESMLPDDSYFQYKKDYWVVERKGKCGIMKRTGETVLPFVYDSISKLQVTYDGRYFGFVYKDGKTGIVNEDGALAVEPTANSYFNNYIDGAGAISLDGRIYSYFNKKGELIWKEPKQNYKSFRAPEFLCMYTNLKSIELGSEKEFDEYFKLPDCFYSLKELTKIEIKNADIDSVSPQIKNFQNLHYFALSSRKIEVLPTELFELKKIDTLVLSIPAEIPTKINDLPALNYLFVSYPKEIRNKNLPPIPQLKHLVYAGDTLPRSIGKFAALKTLVFDKTARLYKQDDYYYSGSKPATSSILSYNKQEVCRDSFMIPKCFYSLKQLEKLVINNEKLDTLLSDLGSLSNLKYLSINGRWGMTIPSEISKLTRLDTVILNSGFVMDSNLVLPSVKYFASKLGNIPNLPAAKYIELTCVDLPKSIFNSKQLETLNITLDNSMGGYYEGGNPSPYDWEKFFINLQEFPNLKELTISLTVGKGDGGSHAFDIIPFKETLLKSKNLKKLTYVSYDDWDKKSLKEAFPTLIIE